MIFMETERLVLRQLRQKDASVMFDYRNNEICSRHQRGQTKSLDGIAALVDKHQSSDLTAENDCIICVAQKDTDEMIGEIVVMPNEGCISLGYTFSYKQHRKGYAYEALSCLIDTLHSRFPDMDFICFTEPENVASMALLQKLGYTNYGYAQKINSIVFGKWVIDDPLK